MASFLTQYIIEFENPISKEQIILALNDITKFISAKDKKIIKYNFEEFDFELYYSKEGLVVFLEEFLIGKVYSIDKEGDYMSFLLKFYCKKDINNVVYLEIRDNSRDAIKLLQERGREFLEFLKTIFPTSLFSTKDIFQVFDSQYDAIEILKCIKENNTLNNDEFGRINFFLSDF